MGRQIIILLLLALTCSAQFNFRDPAFLAAAVPKVTGLTNVTAGLVGWWKVDDASGVVAVDSSGNSNTGYTSNSPAWTSGVINGAITLNGLNQFVNLGDPESLESSVGANGVMTVATWVKPPAITNSVGVVGKYKQSGFYQWLFAVGASGVFYFYAFDGGLGISTVSVTSTTTLSAGQWTHISVVYDNSQTGTTNKIKLYKNGVLETPVAGSSGSFSAIANTAIATRLGALEDTDGSALSPVVGDIDDSRIYSRALNATEIGQIYQWRGEP